MEKVTVTTWDHYVEDAKKYTNFDRTETSTLTDTSGTGEDGQPFTTESIVNEWDEKDATKSFVHDEGGSGISAWNEDTTTTNTITENGTHSMTTTLSGPEVSQKASTTIDRDSTHKDETVELVHYYGLGPILSGGESYEDRRETTTTTTTQTDNSHYASSHTVGTDGQAIDGRFETHGRQTDKVEAIYTNRMDAWYIYPGPGYDDYLTWHDDDRETDASEITNTFSESGNYHDERTDSGDLKRIQSGTYTITSTLHDSWNDQWVHQETTDYETDSVLDRDTISKDREHGFDKQGSQVSGSYGPGGGKETRAYWSESEQHVRDYGWTRRLDGPNDEVIISWSREQTDEEKHVPREGTPTGTTDYGLWTGHYEEFDDPQWTYTTDDPPPEDLFGGEDPPALPPATSVNELENETYNDPGTFDVEIQVARLKTALKIADDYIVLEKRLMSLESNIWDLQSQLRDGERRIWIEPEGEIAVPLTHEEKAKLKKNIHDLWLNVNAWEQDLANWHSQLDEEFGDLVLNPLYPFHTDIGGTWSWDQPLAAGGTGTDAILDLARALRYETLVVRPVGPYVPTDFNPADLAGAVISGVARKAAAKALVAKFARPSTANPKILRFFYDSRAFRLISKEYWIKRADGRALHHWLIPQRWKWVPQGIRNAGFNLVELPALRGVFHPKLNLNTWMGFARNWRGIEPAKAAAVEWGIRIIIPGSIGGAIGGGVYLGRLLGDHFSDESQ